MGNKASSPPPVMTNVEVRPRCVHRGCMSISYGGGVMCVDHVKEAKRKQAEEEEGKAKKKQGNGAVSEHS